MRLDGPPVPRQSRKKKKERRPAFDILAGEQEDVTDTIGGVRGDRNRRDQTESGVVGAHAQHLITLHLMSVKRSSEYSYYQHDPPFLCRSAGKNHRGLGEQHQKRPPDTADEDELTETTE